MTLLPLAARSLWNRRTTAGLTVLSIAISVALLLSVRQLSEQARTAFASTISGTDLIVGAPGQSLADLASAIPVHLTVIDAVRILVRNGPTGGNLRDVEQRDTIIASSDIVAADAYGATLFGKTGADLAYIKAADAMGLGKMDYKQLGVREVRL